MKEEDGQSLRGGGVEVKLEEEKTGGGRGDGQGCVASGRESPERSSEGA